MIQAISSINKYPISHNIKLRYAVTILRYTSRAISPRTLFTSPILTQKRKKFAPQPFNYVNLERVCRDTEQNKTYSNNTIPKLKLKYNKLK